MNYFIYFTKRSCVTKFIKIQTVKSTTKLSETKKNAQNVKRRYNTANAKEAQMDKLEIE